MRDSCLSRMVRVRLGGRVGCRCRIRRRGMGIWMRPISQVMAMDSSHNNNSSSSSSSPPSANWIPSTKTNGAGSSSESPSTRTARYSISIPAPGSPATCEIARSTSPTPNCPIPAGNGPGRPGTSTCPQTWTSRAGSIPSPFPRRRGTARTHGSIRLCVDGDGCGCV